MRQLFHGVMLGVILCASAARADLAGYVGAKDDSYKWTRIGGSDTPVAYVDLHMVSQTWRGIVWQHKLIIVRPAGVEKTTPALLLISGGSWREGREREAIKPDSRDLRTAQALAMAIRMPVAVLQYVPFQPVFGGMHEDQIIAHTFDQYLKTGEEDWPLLLPMTKAAVRAMDTVQQYARNEWKLEVTKFIVTGASKRGWTTWLTAAVDGRVAAIAPMVIDVLNMGPQMKRQREVYGGFSEQIRDYTQLDIQGRMDTEAGRKLTSIVDPFAYRQKLTMPKFILLGTNDPYWTLDAANLYYDDLPGEKRLLYVPNAGHGLNDLGRVIGAVSALALEVTGELKLPKLTWNLREQDGGLRMVVRSDVKPLSVSAWLAESKTRDFRKAQWRSQVVAEAGGEYAHAIKTPQTGFAAMFGEAVYDIEGRRVYQSTNVRVIGQAQPPGANR